MPKPIHIFVVDQHAAVRIGLTTMLESEPDMKVVGTAASGRDALEKISVLSPDVVVTDLHLREMGGEEMLNQLQERFPQIRSVVLSTKQPEHGACAALRAGATAYLPKCSSLEEVTATIRKVHAGESQGVPPAFRKPVRRRA